MNNYYKGKQIQFEDSEKLSTNYEPGKHNKTDEKTAGKISLGRRGLIDILQNNKHIKHTCGKDKPEIHKTEISVLQEEDYEFSENDQFEGTYCKQIFKSEDKDVEVESYESVEPELIIKDFLHIHQGDLSSNETSDKVHNLMEENEILLLKTSRLQNEIERLQYENKTMKTTISKEEIKAKNANPTIEELRKVNMELNVQIEKLQAENVEKDNNVKVLFDILQNIPKKLNDFILSQKTRNIGNDRTNILINKLKDLNSTISKVPSLASYPLIKASDKPKAGSNNIKVICRIKPDIDNCLSVPTNSTIFLPPFRHFDKGIGYSLNKVFCANSTQDEIFNEISPILKYCFSGFNVCVLTYGQSGSGKTHTMLGKHSDPGIILLSMKELLKTSEESTSTIYKFYLSILEVYNETIYDLLNSAGDNKTLIPKSKVFIQDNGHSVQIKNVSEAEISNVKELDYYINRSTKQRTPSGTSKNANSSRSHFLVMVRICGMSKNINDTSNRGVLMLCDLAGSEQIEGLTDKEQTESKFINKSITILSRVLDALYKKLPVIPYRDSKLTHLLKPSLMGNAKCVFIATVCSQPENLLDTNRTLNVAKKVELISFNSLTS